MDTLPIEIIIKILNATVYEDIFLSYQQIYYFLRCSRQFKLLLHSHFQKYFNMLNDTYNKSKKILNNITEKYREKPDKKPNSWEYNFKYCNSIYIHIDPSKEFVYSNFITDTKSLTMTVNKIKAHLRSKWLGPFMFGPETWTANMIITYEGSKWQKGWKVFLQKESNIFGIYFNTVDMYRKFARIIHYQIGFAVTDYNGNEYFRYDPYPKNIDV